MKHFKVFALLFTTLLSLCSFSKTYGFSDLKVKNITEFNQAVKNAKPGDNIILANGNWQNTELVFKGKGTKSLPITLKAEENGKVILSGLSNLRISGEYLIVSGLVFKNGYTPTTEVISFKTSSKELANNCRLTETVIDNFSNPERQESDYWIGVYGKNNRIDHNHFEGKRNVGVTMAVRLNSVESQENFHQIDHNYFGPRPILGSNGGETLRIGTSHYSLTKSNTIVEYNYFDRCDGEVEIISNKSGSNTYRYNTFFESQGTLTIRHGRGNTVDGNLFLGNNVENTGGIRVINEDQTIINNILINLAGYRFRSALTIMNGVPNSPINRYNSVDNAKISNNAFINCNNIQFGVGSDAERSAVPTNSMMTNNLFYNEKTVGLFDVFDDMSGIKFSNNFVSENTKTDMFKGGFTKTKFKLVKDKMGFTLPEVKGIKPQINENIATKDNTGTGFYSKADKEIQLSSGKIIKVAAGQNTLYDAAKNSEPGDILELTSSDIYTTDKIIEINHPLTFKSDLKIKPTILFEKQALFQIENGGSLALENLIFDGKDAPDYTGNAVIRTSKYSMNHNYILHINNCNFINLDVNNSFDVVVIAKNTMANLFKIENSTFDKISGNVVSLDKEVDDTGIYNAEKVILNNNVFSNISGTVLQLYRGGTDESTTGPFLNINHCIFDNVGNGKKNKSNAAMLIHGAQGIRIENNIFTNSKKIKLELIVGEPVVNILNNNFFKTESTLITGDQKFTEKDNFMIDPAFTNKNYELPSNSTLNAKGTDKMNIGLIQKK
ncbi:polysaccharide lyase 6 family protein [Frigoriflavimonas asaccharolytica]|uniref:Poly(Beta-D-mannuronate) lyase n=1 Tax=Frigoriflavimonas asaccharolytica TaxID=2735899 RepID=A0A8J8K8G7_9FLAO|nr:polysaccharide lyase 6 family protein [Frigoriflavimonas asaccharolytica]NRS92611.1 poly(beta-D-mannuronate) lyase [Frigoriflavimonas asaccharolytica]